MGETGGSFGGAIKPILHCPWLSVVAVLVIVGSIPPGDLFFCFFFANPLFWGAIAVQLGSLGPPEKAADGYIPMGPKNLPKRQKPRSWRWKLPVFQLPFGQSGAFFRAYGQMRAAARDVN